MRAPALGRVEVINRTRRAACGILAAFRRRDADYAATILAVLYWLGELVLKERLVVHSEGAGAYAIRRLLAILHADPTALAAAELLAGELAPIIAAELRARGYFLRLADAAPAITPSTAISP